MKWSNVKLILVREVRDQLRDRRTLFMIAVLPLLLYPLLGMSFFQISQFMREHASQVLVIGAPLPAVTGNTVAGNDAKETGPVWPPLLDGERFDKSLFTHEDRAGLIALKFGTDQPGGTVDWATATNEEREADAQRLLRPGDAEVIVYFPPEFSTRLADFRRLLLERDDPHNVEIQAIPSPQIFFNTASEKSQIALTRATQVLERWTVELGRQNLRDSKVPILAAKPFDLAPMDVAVSGHRDAAMWSKVLPFVLLIWALTGAFYPAIDLCAGEKERGTLETLLCSPAERSEIVWGKLLTVMLFSVATAVLNLLSMALTGAFVVNQLQHLGGINIGLPPAGALVWLLVALLPVSALFSALCLALAAFARSTKEGQYYLMPLVLITMPLMILPMAPGVELTLGNSLIPVSGVVLVLRSLLEGNYLRTLPFLIPVTAVTLACCLLAIRWAVDQFNRESVLFRESERLDLGLWVRRLVRDRGPTPTIAEALSCFLLILMIQFFMNLALRPDLTRFADVAGMIFISLVVVIALPALLMAIVLTRSPRKTLLFDRQPAWWSIPLAVTLAAFAHPVSHGVSVIVQSLYPIGPHAESLGETMTVLFEKSPYPWLPFVLIALLPAVCEELAFRGFILSGLRHLGHKWGAIGLSAVFFGIAHGVLQQSIMAALMGLLLGYLAVQTGSLWPCIAYHLTHNSLTLLSTQYNKLEAAAWGDNPLLGLLLTRSAEDGVTYSWSLIVVGALVSAYLIYLLHRLPYQKTREEQLQEALDHQQLPVGAP